MADAAFPTSQALTANQAGYNPLSGWQNEFLPFPAMVTVLARATTTGVRLTAYSGTQTIQPRSQVQGGGTAGVTPSPLNTSPITFRAPAGDRLQLLFDEVAGGTPTVDVLTTLDFLV